MCGIDSHVYAYGLINKLIAEFLTCPNIYTFMNVVVIDLSPFYEMLLCRKWSVALGGHIQMDLSYVFIPNSDGKMICIY